MKFWWHHKVLGHAVLVRRVTVPVWDPSARGVLYDCICGHEWAR